AHAQVVQPDFWGTDGEVTSIARVGNIIYLAGSFSNVGPTTGGGVPIDRVSGALRPHFPRVNGIVHAVISDRSVGWFVGGAIAAVNASTGAVSTWNPQADGAVTALVAERGTLFVGGSFSTVAGRSRPHLAAFTLADGSLTAWNPAADGTVLTIALARNLAWV